MTEGIPGKRILLTGASAGIGHVAAKLLAQQGALVFATGRRAERLQALADAVPLAGWLAGDLADPGFTPALLQAAGEIDVLVNNAGTLKHHPFLESAEEDWRRVIDVNVTSLLRLTRQAVIPMVARGDGHIVNVTSLLARIVIPNTLVYAATKHAVHGICEGLRVELRAKGIRVSEVAPGLVETEIKRDIDDERVLGGYRRLTFPLLQPDDVASAIAYVIAAPPHATVDYLEVRPRLQPG